MKKLATLDIELQEINRLKSGIVSVRNYLGSLPTNLKKDELWNIINNAAESLTSLETPGHASVQPEHAPSEGK